MVDGISDAVSFKQSQTDVQVQVAVLDKALETEKKEAEELLKTLDVGQNLDVVA